MSRPGSTPSAELDRDQTEPEVESTVPADEGRAADASTPPAEGGSAWRQRLRRVPLELVILTAVAAVTRFAMIYDPRAIVFDETYFREFALHYQQGTYYFDLHPPLGKLILGAWAAIVGADALPQSTTDPEVALRLLPAFFGTLLIPAFYALVRELSHSRRIATLGAALLLLETAILVESRYTLMDSTLLLSGIVGVWLAVRAFNRTGRSAWVLWSLAAFFAGTAASIKLTGLATLGLVGVLWLVSIARRRSEWPSLWKPALGQAVLLALIPATIYLSSFAVHFALLPKSGPGDAFMPVEFQETLVGNPNYKPDASISFLTKFRDLNGAIHQYELSLNESTHPYASKWTSWPIAKRGIFLYIEDVGNGRSRYIYANGNPAIWWGTLLGGLVVIAGWVARRERFTKYKWPLLFLGFAWAANYLPFSLIVRPMFLYHYFFALMFSLAFVVIGLGALFRWNDDRPSPFRFATRRSTVAYWGLIGVALLSFLYFAPTTYGLPLTPEGLDARMWLSSWR